MRLIFRGPQSYSRTTSLLSEVLNYFQTYSKCKERSLRSPLHRSHGDSESFFVILAFGFIDALPIPNLLEDVAVPVPFRAKGKLPIMFIISGKTQSFIAELIALLICVCIVSNIESLS